MRRCLCVCLCSSRVNRVATIAPRAEQCRDDAATTPRQCRYNAAKRANVHANYINYHNCITRSRPSREIADRITHGVVFDSLRHRSTLCFAFFINFSTPFTRRGDFFALCLAALFERVDWVNCLPDTVRLSSPTRAACFALVPRTDVVDSS